MSDTDAILSELWPVHLRADQLVLRPVSAGDEPSISQLLTDVQVRKYLGGPVAAARVAGRTRDYLGRPGAWAVVPSGGGSACGLVTLGSDHRCTGRAELSFQLLPSVWGRGLGWEAVDAVRNWWTCAVPDGGPLVAITQERNEASRRLLESLGMVLVDEFDEYGERQCLYTQSDTEEAELRWLRLLEDRREQAERLRGARARDTLLGRLLPADLSALGFEEMARLCPARHGAHGRVCARDMGHKPDFHLGRAGDGAWIAWNGSADD